MRCLTLCAIAVLVAAFSAYGQEAGNPNRSYSLLRENEDWKFLKDPTLRQDFWDPIKYIPLRAEGWYLTVGGEIREVAEKIANDNWGKQPYTNSFFLQRYMLHTDWHLGKHYRVFVQLKSGLQLFRNGGPRPIDEKKLDLEAAYLEVGNPEGKNWVVLRVGRQELNYGSGRLVSVREGPNVRQSFDGVKIRARAGAWNIDAFAARPDSDKTGFLNNPPDHQTTFWGIYATRAWTSGISFDTYYLGEARKSVTFNRGRAEEVRHTSGARLWRPISTKKPALDFDYEAVLQLGTFGTNGIRAWTMASDHGYSLPNLPLKPRFSMKADISSGDDPRNHQLGTFSPLFPVGNYFGVLADTGPGPVNFIDLHPRIQTQLPHGITVSTDLVAQWRQNLRDGVYAVPGFLLVPAGESRARFVGYRPGVEVRWQMNRHAYLQADYGVFYAGEFLKQASAGRNINYTALWAGYKF